MVVSGGGMRGYYCTGAWITLRQLVRRGDISIARFAGTSAGAWCSVFMCCELDPIDWIETYYQTKARVGEKLLDAYHSIIPNMILPTLPTDAYSRCSGRCFISISVLRGGSVRNEVVSQFASNEDLVSACVASSNIPFIATKALGKRFRGNVVLDGGLTNNLPCFHDSRRPQLLFDLSKVAYPMQSTLSPSDPCVEALIVRGAIEMPCGSSRSASCCPLPWLAPQTAPCAGPTPPAGHHAHLARPRTPGAPGEARCWRTSALAAASQQAGHRTSPTARPVTGSGMALPGMSRHS